MARRGRYLGAFAYHLSIPAPVADALTIWDFSLYAEVIEDLISEHR